MMHDPINENVICIHNHNNKWESKIYRNDDVNNGNNTNSESSSSPAATTTTTTSNSGSSRPIIQHTIYEWLQQNMNQLLPSPYSSSTPSTSSSSSTNQHSHHQHQYQTMSSTNASEEQDEEQSNTSYRVHYRLVSHDKYILSLNHTCLSIGEMARENPHSLKLIIEVFPPLVPTTTTTTTTMVTSSSSSHQQSQSVQQQQESQQSMKKTPPIYRVQYTFDYQNYYNRKGNESFRNKNYEQAIQHYNVSIKRYPWTLTALCNRSLCHYRTKNYLMVIHDINQLFIQNRAQQQQQQQNDSTSSDSAKSLVPKSYMRRGRSYFALADVIRNKMNQFMNQSENDGNKKEQVMMDLLASVINEGQVMNLIMSHETHNDGPLSEQVQSTLVYVEHCQKRQQQQQQQNGENGQNSSHNNNNNNNCNSVIETLSSIRLTLLQLCIHDFSRALTEFEESKKNELASIEYDKAIWELLHHIPHKLNVCPLRRNTCTMTMTTTATQQNSGNSNSSSNSGNSSNALLFVPVIPLEAWSLETMNPTLSQPMPFMAKGTDPHGRIAQYETMFKDQVLKAFYLYEHVSSSDERSDSVAVDQSQSSWCSTVLTWTLFKWFFAQRNFYELVSNTINYAFFSKCRSYLLHVLLNKTSTEKLPDKMYPLRFSVMPVYGPVQSTELNKTVGFSMFTEASTAANKAGVIQFVAMKFGANLYISAGKFEVLNSYKLKNLISHGHDTVIERQKPDSVYFPPILDALEFY